MLGNRKDAQEENERVQCMKWTGGREGRRMVAEVKHRVEGLVTQKSRSQQLPTQETHSEGGGSRAETDPNPVGLPF